MLQLLYLFWRPVSFDLADEPEDSTVQVFPISKCCDLDVILQSSSKKVESPWLLDYIIGASSSASHYEIAINQKRHVLDDPVFCRSFLELVPLVGIEMFVNIGNVKVLAEQPAKLGFGSHRIVADNERSLRLFVLHCL